MTRLNESLLLESSRLSTDIRHMPRQSALNLLPIDQSLQRSQEALNSLEALTAGHLVLVARMRGVRVAKCLCSMAIRLDRLVFNDSHSGAEQLGAALQRGRSFGAGPEARRAAGEQLSKCLGLANRARRS